MFLPEMETNTKTFCKKTQRCIDKIKIKLFFWSNIYSNIYSLPFC